MFSRSSGLLLPWVRAWLKGGFLTELFPLSETSSPPPSTHALLPPSNTVALSFLLYFYLRPWWCIIEDILGIRIWLTSVSFLDHKVQEGTLIILYTQDLEQCLTHNEPSVHIAWMDERIHVWMPLLCAVCTDLFSSLVRSTVVWKLKRQYKPRVRTATLALPGYTQALGLCFLICSMAWQWHLPCRVVIMTIRGHCIGWEQNLARCRHSINISCCGVLFQMNEVTWARITVLLGGRGRIRTHIRLPLEAESGLGHDVNFLHVFEVDFKDTRQISLKYSSSWKDGAFNTTNGTAPSWSLQGHWSI